MFLSQKHYISTMHLSNQRSNILIFNQIYQKIELSFWRYYSMSIINNQTMRRLMHQNSNTTDKLKQNINNKLQE